jgi:hypothetical protein
VKTNIQREVCFHDAISFTTCMRDVSHLQLQVCSRTSSQTSALKLLKREELHSQNCFLRRPLGSFGFDGLGRQGNDPETGGYFCW